MRPAVSINSLVGLLEHLVVTSHDHEAAIAEFTALTYRHDLTGCRIDDFDLDIWQRFPTVAAFNANGSSASVMVMQQLPSVCPKQMPTSAPSRFFTCSIRKRGTGAPPDPTTLSEERSW